MRVSAVGDVIKVWVWALSSLVIGLWLTLMAYNGGKALFELSETKDFNGALNKFAAWSGAAKLENFFMICWTVVAALLLLPLIDSLRHGGSHIGRKKPTEMSKSHLADVIETGQGIRPNRWELRRALLGFLVTIGCFLLFSLLMMKAGAYGWVKDPRAWREGVFFDIGIALALSALIAILFRCAILSVFFRAMNAPAAIALAALMFGGARYILSGFAPAETMDIETLSVVELFGMIISGGDAAARIVTYFVPWFTFGCLLGWANWRVPTVWLPGGLLMGWLFANRLSAYLTFSSMQTALVPLLSVFAVAVFVHLFTRRHALRENTSE